MAPRAEEASRRAPAGVDELGAALARYRGPCLAQYALPAGVGVTVSDDAAVVEEALQAFFAADDCVVGLDTEWADAACSIALLQLATRGAGCLIVRLPRLSHLPASLERLLLDERKLKVGVAIAQDLKLLEKQFGLKSAGFVDLQPLAMKHDFAQHGVGLAGICQCALGRKLSKEIRRSDWSGELSAEQVEYAACDAFVSIDIIETMHRRRAAPGEDLRAWCGDLVDRVPKGLRLQAQIQGEKKHRVQKKVIHAPQRKTDLYGGCQLLNPDGLHLANVSEAKARWYMAQGLGVQVHDETSPNRLVVKLTFQPKGVGHAGDDYYLQVMENRCVGCGVRKDIVRFSIVPHVFRSQLPTRFKEHSSHDIVLLCHDCFVVASDASQDRRRRALKEHGLGDGSGPGAPGPWRQDDARVRARGAAMALRAPRLPAGVRAVKEDIVRKFLGREEDSPLSEQDVEGVRNMCTKFAVEGYVPPEVACAQRLGLTECTEDGDADALEKRCYDFVVAWRHCFLQSVKPQFLPSGWDVSRSIRKHDDLFGPLPPAAPGGQVAEGGA